MYIAIPYELDIPVIILLPWQYCVRSDTSYRAETACSMTNLAAAI